MRALVVSLALAAGLAPMATDESVAQSAIAATRYYKVVEHGKMVEIDHGGSFDPNCHSIGTADVNLLRAPVGGEVQTSIARRFPSYVTSNVRARCDTRQLAQTVIFYRARPDFVGSDTFDVEWIFPSGIARKVRYGISVR